MRVLGIVVATLLLAGCAESPPEEVAEAAPVETEPQSTTLNLAADLLLHRISLHRGTAVGVGLPGDTNCVWLRRVPVADEFTVTATWDAVTPAWERLEMTIQHEEGQEFASGPSPLTIIAKDLSRDQFFEGIGTILQPEIPGPVLDQPVHLEVVAKANLDSDSEPELERGGCTWGRLV
ncbi:MAG: hypothetical protein ACYC2H_01590 [Thermoplasmatota archaeon]